MSLLFYLYFFVRKSASKTFEGCFSRDMPIKCDDEWLFDSNQVLKDAIIYRNWYDAQKLSAKSLRFAFDEKIVQRTFDGCQWIALKNKCKHLWIV